MAQHKSATDVTVARLEERSGFEEFVHRYWKLGAVAFAALAGLVLWRQSTAEEQVARKNEGWDEVVQHVQVASGTFGLPEVQLAAPEVLESASQKAGDDGAGAWSQALASIAYFDNDQPEQALEAIRAFQQRYGEHPIARWDADGAKSGSALATDIETRLAGLAELKASLPQLSGNPAAPEGSPRVVLETSAGEIEIALRPDIAPGHVENFLELCANGTYLGTKFHRIMPTMMIQGGDQNSIDGAPETWGTGDAGYTQPQEFGNLYHYPGVLAMAKRPDQTESSGHQFYITVAPAHHLDDVHTIFGQVVRGQDVADRIANGPVAENTTDRAAEPVTLDATRVL